MVCGNWGDFNAFSTLWLHVPLSSFHRFPPLVPAIPASSFRPFWRSRSTITEPFQTHTLTRNLSFLGVVRLHRLLYVAVRLEARQSHQLFGGEDGLHRRRYGTHLVHCQRRQLLRAQLLSRDQTQDVVLTISDKLCGIRLCVQNPNGQNVIRLSRMWAKPSDRTPFIRFRSG